MAQPKEVMNIREASQYWEFLPIPFTSRFTGANTCIQIRQSLALQKDSARRMDGDKSRNRAIEKR